MNHLVEKKYCSKFNRSYICSVKTNLNDTLVEQYNFL